MGGHPGAYTPPSVVGVGGYRVTEAGVYMAGAGYVQPSVSVGGGGAPTVHVRVEVMASPPAQPALERRSSMPYYPVEQQPPVQPTLQHHPSGSSLSSSDAAVMSLVRRPGVGGIGWGMGGR